MCHCSTIESVEGWHDCTIRWQSSEAELNVLRTHQQASQEIHKEIKEREEQLVMLSDRAKEYKASVEDCERREEALKVKIVVVDSRK